jgi:hypothetical protein
LDLRGTKLTARSEWQIVPDGERSTIALRIAAAARLDSIRESME